MFREMLVVEEAEEIAGGAVVTGGDRIGRARWLIGRSALKGVP